MKSKTKNKMRVAIYAKGSHEKTAKAQERDLRRLCQQREWAVDEVYIDPPGRPPKMASGKARIALIDALLRRKNKVGVVCVWRVSMLGNCIDDLLWLLNEVHLKRGIHVVAPGDGIDTTTDDSMKKVLKALARV
jgi:DNA invertase Pin-like site-specific DNA recombinase